MLETQIPQAVLSSVPVIFWNGEKFLAKDQAKQSTIIPFSPLKQWSLHSWKILHMLKLYRDYLMSIFKAELGLNLMDNYEQAFNFGCLMEHRRVLWVMGLILHCLGLSYALPLHSK